MSLTTMTNMREMRLHKGGCGALGSRVSVKKQNLNSVSNMSCKIHGSTWRIYSLIQLVLELKYNICPVKSHNLKYKIYYCLHSTTDLFSFKYDPDLFKNSKIWK